MKLCNTISFLLLIVLGGFCAQLEANTNKKIKLYAMFTPSHKILVDDWFLPSIQDDFEIILTEFDQECPSGTFLQKGWTTTTRKKVDMIIKAVEENMGDIFVYSDVDIQFFASIKEEIITLLADNDLIIQQDKPTRNACSGFFVCRANEKTLKLWQTVRAYMQEDIRRSDQASLNHFLRNKSFVKSLDLKWELLPIRYFGGGTCTGRQWLPGRSLPVPSNIRIHHANFTRGIHNKIRQLHYVRQMVQRLRAHH